MNVIATLFPEDPTALREVDHLESLVRQALAEGLRDRVTFWVASAHRGALEQAEEVFGRWRWPNWRTLPTEFRPHPALDELRAHEIAHGKRFLARAWEALAWDWLCYYDADVE